MLGSFFKQVGVLVECRGGTRIAALAGAGKSAGRIAAELNRSRNTIAAYITALRQAQAGTFVHQSTSAVREDLILPYLRKDLSITQPETEPATASQSISSPAQDAASAHVQSRLGQPLLDAEKVLLIAGELEAKTPPDIITRLLRVDMMTVNRVRSFIGFLKNRDNDQAASWHHDRVFAPEAFEALEFRYNFFPKEKTSADLEAEFRKDLLMSIDLTNDLLNSIDDLLRMIVKDRKEVID